MTLSILILALDWRNSAPLQEELRRQIADGHLAGVEVVIEMDDGLTPYADKYRRGLLRCTGDYVCSLDDDDWVTSNYLAMLLSYMEGKPICVTFNLLNTSNGETWAFVKGAQDWMKTEQGYIMAANQLCAWRRDLLLRAPMPDLPYGSDVAFCAMLNHSGERGNANRVERTLYIYRFDFKTTARQKPKDVKLARYKADGGLDGFRHRSTGALFISEWGRAHNGSNTTEISVRSAEGVVEAYPRNKLENLFTVTI